ncbi:hypothetical protein C358_03922 [Cryptococcus neoformans MW-RSA852]|nr:hypothetical protein C358_03922 [Cryptococcus neoformans var. grubii MW-RSA852]
MPPSLLLELLPLHQISQQ